MADCSALRVVLKPVVMWECCMRQLRASCLRDGRCCSSLWIAGADADALACGKEVASFAKSKTAAKSLAEATAIAVSFIYASCDTDKGSYACASAATQIESAAKAVAKVHPPSPPVTPMRCVSGKELLLCVQSIVL